MAPCAPYTAVALASFKPEVGIDLEEIKERDAGFAEMVVNAEELNLYKNHQHKTEGITQWWVAKEAYGKSMGVGLQGDPRKYTISEVHDDSLKIKNTWIQTFKYNQFMIGYTNN